MLLFICLSLSPLAMFQGAPTFPGVVGNTCVVSCILFILQALRLGILILGLSKVSILQDRNQVGHSLFFVPHCRTNSGSFGPSSLVSSWLFIGKYLFLLTGEMPAWSLIKAQLDIPTSLLLDDRIAQEKVWDGMGESLGNCLYYSWKDPGRFGQDSEQLWMEWDPEAAREPGFLSSRTLLAFLTGLHHLLSSSFSLSHALSLCHLVSVTIWVPLITNCLSQSSPFLL